MYNEDIFAEKKKIRKVRLPKSVQLSIPIDNKTTFNLKLKEQREEIENPEIASDDRRGVLVLHPADKSEVDISSSCNIQFQVICYI